ACNDPSQECLAQGFDHSVDDNDLACVEEDQLDPGPSKDFWHALCECDQAAALGLCNSSDPAIQAAIGDNQNGWGDFCQSVADGANASVAHAEICPQVSAACYARVGNEVRTQNANCSSKCFQDCHENKGATDTSGKRRYAFGRPQDLNHDLVE